MKVLVVGLGIQGKKRLAVAGPDVAGTVDPAVPAALYRAIEEVPLERYDGALVCTPDSAKIPVLAYLLAHGKHVLVEKPLVASRRADLERLRSVALPAGTLLYTAYNHRFEPHLAAAKRVLDSGTIGRVYQARFFYGNGTARDVRGSPWRDKGLGVVADLASHLLDLTEMLFGRPHGAPEIWSCQRYENAAFDRFLIGWSRSRPVIELEGTLLSWRNTFSLDVVGELGSLHVQGLMKWGPSALVVRRRVLPSGKPPEEVHTLEGPDPTWEAEYAHWKALCAGAAAGSSERGHATVASLDRDLWINDLFTELATRLEVASWA